MTGAFADLHEDCRALGARLFTVTVHDPGARLYRRAYTSHPADYPLSGTKPMVSDAWTAHVIGRGQSFVANAPAEFAPLFADHAAIVALGCRSALNIPIVRADGAVVATVNILHDEGHFTPDRVAAYEERIAARMQALLQAVAAVELG